MEPINVPHHIIPGSPPPTHITTTPKAPGSGAARTVRSAVEAIHHNIASHLQVGGHFSILAVTGILLGGVALAVLLLRTLKTAPLQTSAPIGGAGAGNEGSSYYIYEGLRAVMRRVFLGLRERASRMLGVRLEAATPREVAIMLDNSHALRFAERYEALMYGLEEPRKPDVDELENAAREALKAMEGRGDG